MRFTCKTAVLFITLSVDILLFSNGECENACSGHGRCTAFDMCICYRNWQSNDCSESKFTSSSVHNVCITNQTCHLSSIYIIRSMWIRFVCRGYT